MEYNDRRACGGLDAEVKLMPPFEKSSFRNQRNRQDRRYCGSIRACETGRRRGGDPGLLGEEQGPCGRLVGILERICSTGRRRTDGTAVMASPQFYDRLVIPTGLQTTVFGQPCHYAHHLLTGGQGRIDGQDFVFDTPLGEGNFIVREGRMLGLSRWMARHRFDCWGRRAKCIRAFQCRRIGHPHLRRKLRRES